MSFNKRFREASTYGMECRTLLKKKKKVKEEGEAKLDYVLMGFVEYHRCGSRRQRVSLFRILITSVGLVNMPCPH